jgi:hypothetical protein
MILKTITHKEHTITINVDERGKFKCTCMHLASTNESDINHYHDSMDDAIIDIFTQLEEFLSNTPKTYTELAEAIHESLEWTGYEDCYVDETRLKILVENFIKARG